MKLILFGTGKIYEDRKKDIFHKDEIVAFLDNNYLLWNTLKDGINIYSPEEVKKLNYDKIILMSSYAAEMCTQLLALGCRREDILHYEEYFYLHREEKQSIDEYIKAEKVLSSNSCLIISNSLGYHGGAMAAVYAAEALQRCNYDVTICAAQGDTVFIEEIKQKGISIIICPHILLTPWEEMEWAHKYRVIIVNTLPMILCALEIAKHRKVIFWLHESEIAYPSVEYWRRKISQEISNSNIQICAVSDVAKRNFINNYGQHNVAILPCGIPDKYKEREKTATVEIVKCAVIGSIYAVKGQDILLKAMKELLPKENELLEVYLIGSFVNAQYEKEIRENCGENVHIVSEVEQSLLADIYSQMDIIVVPSRQETMSLVAIEAMMQGKTCIVSDCAGIADYIENEINGLVFETEQEISLRNCIRWCLRNKEKIRLIGKEARKSYEKYFSLDIFEKSLEEYCEQLL